MTREDVEAAVVLLTTAVAAYDKSSRLASQENVALVKDAREVLSLKTWRPPASAIQLTAHTSESLAARKEG